MQTQQKLDIFDNTPTKAEITCRRIIEYCRNADNKPHKRFEQVMTIKEILKEVL